MIGKKDCHRRMLMLCEALCTTAQQKPVGISKAIILLLTHLLCTSFLPDFPPSPSPHTCFLPLQEEAFAECLYCIPSTLIPWPLP